MTSALVRRRGPRLRPDASRVVAQLFVAGQEVVGGSEARASGVVARVLALDEHEVVRRVDELLERFGHRHRDLAATFSHHADRIENRLPADADLSEARWLFLGATFTHEYAIEATALCNPSIVPLPDQSAAAPGTLQFAMSVRGIGEGHRSSIGFRTGVVAADGAVELEPPGPFAAIGTAEPAMFNRGLFLDRLRALGKASESASYVLGNLPPRFSAEELELQLAVLAEQRDTRRNAQPTAALLRSLAGRSYAAHFHPDSLLSERVLSPAMEVESHGMEDARFVRFVDDDGDATYYASYTAYDGVRTTQQLLHTSDFKTFTVSPLLGPAAANKGLALFPRTIQGRYAALSRYDRETNAVAFSETLGHWGDAVTYQLPDREWEVIQLGNCGSPIETNDGWLVLTHGVGPMRTYSIGALLLDLDDPTKVLASLDEPLLTPDPDEQDGYVPNVVYSCGGLLHGDMLVVPYGIADCSIGFATVAWPDLRDAMT